MLVLIQRRPFLVLETGKDQEGTSRVPAPDKAVMKADRRAGRGGGGRDVMGMRMDLLLRDGGISSAS